MRVAIARDRAAWLTRERLIFGLFERSSSRYLGEVALHYLDNLDAKIHTYGREIREDPSRDSAWTLQSKNLR